MLPGGFVGVGGIVDGGDVGWGSGWGLGLKVNVGGAAVGRFVGHVGGGVVGLLVMRLGLRGLRVRATASGSACGTRAWARGTGPTSRPVLWPRAAEAGSPAPFSDPLPEQYGRGDSRAGEYDHHARGGQHPRSSEPDVPEVPQVPQIREVDADRGRRLRRSEAVEVPTATGARVGGRRRSRSAVRACGQHAHLQERSSERGGAHLIGCGGSFPQFQLAVPPVNCELAVPDRPFVSFAADGHQRGHRWHRHRSAVAVRTGRIRSGGRPAGHPDLDAAVAVPGHLTLAESPIQRLGALVDREYVQDQGLVALFGLAQKQADESAADAASLMVGVEFDPRQPGLGRAVFDVGASRRPYRRR